MRALRSGQWFGNWSSGCGGALPRCLFRRRQMHMPSCREGWLLMVLRRLHLWDPLLAKGYTSSLGEGQSGGWSVRGGVHSTLAPFPTSRRATSAPELQVGSAGASGLEAPWFSFSLYPVPRPSLPRGSSQELSSKPHTDCSISRCLFPGCLT